jgi:hypothetical protein
MIHISYAFTRLAEQKLQARDIRREIPDWPATEEGKE